MTCEKKQNKKKTSPTFDFITFQNFPERLEELFQIFGGAHATQIAYEDFGGVKRASLGLLHHQVTTFKLPAIELAYGAFSGSVSLQVDEGELPENAAVHHLTVRLEDRR